MPDPLAALQARQDARLAGPHAGIATAAQAVKLLARVGVALRYGPTRGLPLASMYAAVAADEEPEADAQRRATILTNQLLADGAAIELAVIAERVTLADAALVPAIVALVRRPGRDRAVELDDMATRVLGFLAHAERPTAGQVRAFLGAGPAWPNPADDALAALQRALLVDRGATTVPKTGAAYLGKDGIPYRLFDRAHPALVTAAAELDVATAAARVVGAYLDGAVFAARRKLASLFKLLVDAAELDAAIAALAAARRARVERIAGKEYIVSAL